MRVAVLKDIEAVRKRPGMYVGDTRGGTGLHAMLYELVDNAIGEALAGYCDCIDVALNAGGSAMVRDNGRGIPADTHPSTGVSAAEFVMTRLHPSAKAQRDARERPGRRHGIGLAVVNALSDLLDLYIWCNGKEHYIRFRGGDPEARLAVVGDAGMRDGKPRRGTEITFLPDAGIFTKTEFDFATVEHHLRGHAVLNAGVTFTLADNRGIEKKEVTLRI
jgi:DNA gyrase subunit B